MLSSVEDADTTTLTSLLSGTDAVVWSAGAGGGDPARTVAVDQDAAIRSMDAAQNAGVRRYVMVSFSGSFPEHHVPEDNPFRAYQDAKIAADEHLRGTDLNWTILAPGTLTTEPGHRAVNPDATFMTGDEASRELVAQVALDVLEDPRASRRTLVFGSGDVPLDTWLDRCGTDMIQILNATEIARARETGALVAEILQTLKGRCTVGTNLLDVDEWARSMIVEAGRPVLLRRLRAVVRQRTVRPLHLHLGQRRRAPRPAARPHPRRRRPAVARPRCLAAGHRRRLGRQLRRR